MKITQVGETGYITFTDEEMANAIKTGETKIKIPEDFKGRFIQIGPPPEDKPVIEVGDWVSLYGTGVYKLIARNSANVCLDDGMGFKLAGIEELTLIRKGPKVYTFESVEIWEHGTRANPAYYPRGYKEGVEPQELLKQFHRDGKWYSMTLTEKSK
jgi:hypothetical protein